MKIYSKAEIEEDPKECAEITVLASANELRKLSKFLENCAKEIEKSPLAWEHAHLEDEFNKVIEDCPSFIVFNSENL